MDISLEGKSISFSKKTPSTKLVKPYYIINPDSGAKLYWNTLVIFSMSFSIILAPIEIAFEDINISELVAIEIISNIIFFFAPIES